MTRSADPTAADEASTLDFARDRCGQHVKNREVADELFIAVKTVEWHLSRIYRKVGVRNRAELIAALN